MFGATPGRGKTVIENMSKPAKREEILSRQGELLQLDTEGHI